MKLKLLLTEIDGEMTPYLWNDALGDNHRADDSTQLRNLADWDVARFSGASNRSRSITIVEGRQAAMSVALLETAEHGSSNLITHLGNDAWAVGSVRRNSEYDSGIPLIFDARMFGYKPELEVEPDLAELLDYTVLAQEHGDAFIEVSPRPEPELAFG